MPDGRAGPADNVRAAAMRATGNTGNGEPLRAPADPPVRAPRVAFDIDEPAVMPGVGGPRRCPYGMLVLLSGRIECPGCRVVWRVRP